MPLRHLSILLVAIVVGLCPATIRAQPLPEKAKDKLAVRVDAGVGHKVTDEDRTEAIAFCVKWLM